MPWRECRKVDERLRLVARLLEGEKVAQLCREFGVSRVTRSSRAISAVVWKDWRIDPAGLIGKRTACPFQIENLILRSKQEHPSWGAPKR